MMRFICGARGEAACKVAEAIRLRDNNVPRVGDAERARSLD